MDFDNKNFENGVRESLNSIKNLTVSLNELDKTNISFDQIQRAANSFNTSNILSNVEKIRDRFSVLGIAGATAIGKLTNSAMDFVGKGLGALTTGIRSAWNSINVGGMQRAMNIEQAKFQIEGLGRAWEEVSGSIDAAVNDTAYGLDEAALAASQFLASGVKTGDEMTTALRSISGVAAMTNSGYSEIANIMTTISGNGRVMTMQLNQLGAKGINAAATLRDYFNSSTENLEKFTRLYNETKKNNQDSLAPGAQATEQAVREMVTNGAIDFETFTKAMDSAYGEHAKDAQRTFEGASSNVQAALKKLGAEFKSITISSEDYDKTLDSNKKADFTKTTFNQINVLNELRNVIKGLQSDMKTAGFVELFSDIYHAVARGASFFLNSLYTVGDNGIKLIPQLSESLSNMKAALENVAGFVVGIASAVSSAWKSVFPQSLPDTILSITSHIRDFTDMLPRVEDISGTISEMFGLGGDDVDDMTESVDNLSEAYNGATGSLRELVHQTINGDFGNGQDRIDALGDSYQQIQDAVNSCYDDQWRLHEDWIDNIDETITVGANLAKTEEDIAQKQKESADIAAKTDESYSKMKSTLEDTVPALKGYGNSFDGLRNILSGFYSLVSIAKSAIVSLVMIVRKFVLPVALRIGEVLIEIMGTIGSFVSALNAVLPTARQTGEAMDVVSDALRPMWNIFHSVTQAIIDFMRAIRPENDPLSAIRGFISGFVESISGLGGKMDNVLSGVTGFAAGLAERIGNLELSNGKKLSETLSSIFDPIVETIGELGDRLKNLKLPDGSTLQSKLKKAFSGVSEYIGKIDERLRERGASIVSFFSSLNDRIQEAVHMDGVSIGNRLEYAFDPVISILGKARERLASAFDPLLEFLSPITDSVSKLASKIVDGLKLLVTSIAEKLADLPNMVSTIRSKFDPIIEYLKPLAQAVKDILSGIVSGIGSFIGNLADSIDFSKNPFEILESVIMTFGNGVAKAFDTIANSKIVATVKDFATTVVEGIKDGAQFIGQGILTVFAPIFAALDEVFGVSVAEAAELDDATGGLEEVGTGLNEANNAIETPANNLADTLSKLAKTIATFLPAIATGLVLLLSIWNIGVMLPKKFSAFMDSLIGVMNPIAGMLSSIRGIFTSISGVFDSISELFGQFSDSLRRFTRAVDFTLIAEGFKSIAIGIAILAGVVILFGMMDWSVVQQGLVMLSVLVATLVGMTALLGLMSKATGLEEFGKSLLMIAGACITFVAALAIMMQMLGAKTETVNGETRTVYTNLQNILVGLGMVALILTAVLAPIVLALKIVGSAAKGIGDLGKAFALIGVGLLLMGFAIEKMKNVIKQVIEDGDLGAFIIGIGLLVALIAVLMIVQGKLAAVDKNSAKAGVGFLLIASSLIVIAHAIQMLSNLSISQIASSTIGLVAVLGTIIGLLYVVSNSEMDMQEVGNGIVKIAVAIGLLSLSLMAISTLGANASYTVGVMAAMIAMIALLAYVCGQASASLTSGGTGILLMAAAIAVLVASMWLMKDVADGGQLGTILTVLVAVTTALAALAAICSMAKSSMIVGAAAIAITAVAIGVLSLALTSLGKDVDSGSILTLVGSLMALMVVLGILGAVANTFKIGFVILGAVLAVVAAVALSIAAALTAGANAFNLIVEAMTRFSEANVNIGEIALGLVALGGSLIVLAVGSGILGAAMVILGAGALVAAVGIGALAMAMYAIIGVVMIVVGLFQMAGDAIMNGLLGGIVNAASGVVSAIQGVGNAIIGGFCSLLGIHSPSTVFETFGGNIMEGLQNGIDGKSISMDGAVNSITSLMEGKEGSLTSTGATIGSTIGTGAQEGITSSFSNMDWESALGDVDLSGISDMFSGSGTDWASSLSSGFSESTEPVEAAEEKVAECAEKAKAKTDEFTKVGETAMQKFTDGMGQFDASKFSEALGGQDENTLAGMIQSQIENIQFNEETFSDLGRRMGDSILAGIDEKSEQVQARIKGMVDAAAGGVTIPDMMAVAKTMGDNFMSGLDTVLGPAYTKGYEIGEQVKSGMGSVSVYETGANFGQGFVNGINSKIDDVKIAGGALALAASMATANVGEVRSPSRVMHRIGGYFGEGFALGIRDKTSRVTSVSEKIADTAVQAMSMLPDFLDADPNLEPTITPVLDMSNVDSGLQAMSSDPMLGTMNADRYYSIATAANGTTAAMAAGNVTYSIDVYLNWEAGMDANQMTDALAQAIEARIRMEG